MAKPLKARGMRWRSVPGCRDRVHPVGGRRTRRPVLRPTKTHRNYRVELDRDTVGVLRVHRDDVQGRARGASVELTGESFVFSNDADGARPWQPNWVTKQFIHARRGAGLPHFRLHDLRHFMATQMLAAGVPIATVSAPQPPTRVDTLSIYIYAHAALGGDRQAAETLTDILGTSRTAGPPST
jgi:integrase